MINIKECQHKASELALRSKEKLGHEKLETFYKNLEKIINEYDEKYAFYSTSIKLESLDSFTNWLNSILDIKSVLTPVLVDKMVNEKYLYLLSVYQNFHAGTNLIPNMDEYKSQYYENGGGENALALITGCHWIEQTGGSELVE